MKTELTGWSTGDLCNLLDCNDAELVDVITTNVHIKTLALRVVRQAIKETLTGYKDELLATMEEAQEAIEEARLELSARQTTITEMMGILAEMQSNTKDSIQATNRGINTLKAMMQYAKKGTSPDLDAEVQAIKAGVEA